MGPGSKFVLRRDNQLGPRTKSGETALRNFLNPRLMPTTLKLLRILWPLPVTVIALLLAAIIRATGGRIEKHGIALETFGSVAPKILWLMNPWANIEAITLGHVIIARDVATAKRLRAHEHTHVRQYERWGVIFPFAYLVASAIAVFKGGDAYRDNIFEVEAFDAALIKD